LCANPISFCLNCYVAAYVGRMSPRRRLAPLLVLAGFGGVLAMACASALLILLLRFVTGSASCGAGPGASAAIALGPPGTGVRAGATEYGGPGDPSSGVVGASGVNLVAHPDSYAELGGTTFQSATMMGGLPYMTPLRITWGTHSAIAYKRDFGLGGGPVDGRPRVIDLWWELAARLGIPYERGLWSGTVEIARAPAAGAANLLGQAATGAVRAESGDSLACNPAALTGVPLTPGDRARLLPDGQAAAPSGAPAAVQAMIAAGNQIVGKPYLYGAAHGLPLSAIAPAYDCSSSVEHLLYGARLLPVGDTVASGALESFGAPGPGRWVTLYASADHTFMYVAGLRWDTHDAAGPGDGSTGIGWHPLIRSAAGFVARHPVGL
jgi:hypothetical protein